MAKSAKEKLLERMKRGQKKGGGDYERTSIFKGNLEADFWSPKEGEQHWFDIIPYEAGPNDPDVEEGTETYCFQPYTHRGVGPNEKDVICLAKTYGRKCAICDHVKKMIADEEDEDEIKALQVQRNPRAIYNVHVLDSKEEQKKGVQIFNASHFTIESHLLELANRPTRPGSTQVDPFIFYPAADETGKTISFKRKSKFEFIAHNLEDRDYALDKKLLKAAHILDECVYIPTYEEQLAWLHGEEYDDEKEDKKEKTRPVREKKKERTRPPKEEEVEEEEGTLTLEEELEKMSRTELKKYIRKNDLKISVKPKMDEEDIIKAILNHSEEEEEEEDGEKVTTEGECPSGHVFGKDLDETDDCDDCPEDVWSACAARAEELEDD